MPWLALAAAAAGVLKAELVDQPKANRARKLAAQTARYSPWTHMEPQAVQDADPLGSAIQFGSTGATLGQGFKNASANADFAKNQSDLLASQKALTDAQTAQLAGPGAAASAVPPGGMPGIAPPTMAGPTPMAAGPKTLPLSPTLGDPAAAQAAYPTDAYGYAGGRRRPLNTWSGQY